jgi:transposase-like protein
MGSYHQYTDTEREAALATVAAADSIAEAARLLGMPDSTLRGWVTEHRSGDRIAQLRDGKHTLEATCTRWPSGPPG